MIASLPMYDRPANRAAHDALWALIRNNLRDTGIAAPKALDRDIDHMKGWAHPDLVLGQICNLPFRAKFRGKVTVIGAADYGLAGCPAGHYHSVIVTRHGDANRPFSDFAKARFAANAMMSHSGYGAAQDWAGSHGFTFGAPLITGSHDASLQAVATGRADIAALDAQTWRMQQQDLPAGQEVSVIAHTTTSPCMTFITKHGQDYAPYFAAIAAAIGDLSHDHAQILGLTGIHHLPEVDYDMPMPPLPAPIDA